MSEVIELSKDADGRWVTINGVHVHIASDGRIDKGPAHFEGKKPDEIDDHEKSGGLLHKETHGGRKVEHALNRIDADHANAAEHVSRTIEELHHMDAANVMDAAREHGIAGVKSKPKAIAALKEFLDNQAEAKTRVETMGEVRADGFVATPADDATRANIERNRQAGEASAKAYAERQAAETTGHDDPAYATPKSADHFRPDRTEFTTAAGEKRTLVRTKVKGQRVMWEEDANGYRVTPSRPYDANAVRHIIEPGEGLIGDHTGGIDRSEPAGTRHGNGAAVAAKVRDLNDRMGTGGSTNVTQAHIDAAVAEIRKMPESDVLAGAKELGIVGAHSKGRAMAMIKQHLENQNEASYRVDTMGKFRMSREALYLSAVAAGPLTPALMLGQGYPTHEEITVGGETKRVPLAYFWKDAIRAGDYVHPATKQTLTVDAARIDGWVERFAAMRKAGIEVPTPRDHKGGAANNLGWVIDARRDGDTLKLLHKAIGEDAAMEALRNRCSLCIEPDYVDEKGRKWGDVFTHNAYTPNPVITGMGSFVPFVASRDGEGETPVFYLSADDGVPEMDPKQLREALGVAADVPDDKLIDAVKTLRATAAADAAKVVTLSRKPAEPDMEALRDRADLTIGRIDLSVAAGDLPPTIAAKLKARVLKDGKPNVFQLSRNDGVDARPIDDVLDLFKGEKLNPPAGSQTNVQLARNVPGGEADAETKAMNDEADARVARMKAAKGIRD